jgi:hypothetical protein
MSSFNLASSRTAKTKLMCNSNNSFFSNPYWFAGVWMNVSRYHVDRYLLCYYAASGTELDRSAGLKMFTTIFEDLYFYSW